MIEQDRDDFVILLILMGLLMAIASLALGTVIYVFKYLVF